MAALDFRVVVSVTGKEMVVVFEPEDKYPASDDDAREQIFWTIDRAVAYLTNIQLEYRGELPNENPDVRL